MKPARSLTIAFAAGVLAIAGWAAASVRTVPADAVALIEGPGGDARVVGPGRHFAARGLATFTTLSPFVRRATLIYSTPEGASVDLAFRAELRPSRAGAERLLAAGRGSTGVDRIASAVDTIALERIRDASEDGGFPRIDEELLARVRGTLASFGEPVGDWSLAYRDDSPVAAAVRQAAFRDEIRAGLHATGEKIVVVGWDGADWQIARPLIEAGRMPHLAALVGRGASGNIRSLTPMLSPLLWTSVATGVTADRHGVLDFLIRDPGTGELVPVSSRFRKVRALWNLFTDAGRSADVVAWWATWPADPIRGRLVSDRVAYSLFDFDMPVGSAGATWPDAYFDEIKPGLVRDGDVRFEDVARFTDVSRAEFDAARAAIATDRKAAYRHPLNHLTKILASTRNYHRIALDLVTRAQADLTLVYYQGIDEVGHRFMHFAPPPLDGIDPADVARYGRAVEEFYVYQDELLGELLDRIDPDSTVVLLSDHGFQNGADRPRGQTADIEGQPGRWHRTFGMFVIAGPSIVPGTLETTSLLDVAPTVLRLAGLPTADDLEGRVLTEAIDPGFLERFPERRVPTYEISPFRVAAAERTAAVASVEAEIVENLRSLGYVGSTATAPGAAPASATGAVDAPVTTHTNLAAVLLASGDLAGADAEIEAALRIDPAFPVARRQRFTVRVQQGRLDEALAVAEHLLDSDADLDERFLARVADTYRDAGKIDAGIAAFRNAAGRGSGPAAAALARLLLDSGDPAAAEATARSVLAVDPRSTAAMVTIFRIAQAEGRLSALRPTLDEALRLQPRSVMHLNWLAIVEESEGGVDRAEALLRRAQDANPDHGGTLANLGAFLGRHGRPREAVDVLRRALALDPGNVDARINLGSALARLDRYDEAVAEFAQVVESGSRRTDVHNAIARLHVLRGDLPAAREWLERSLEIDPDQDDVREALAGIR